jgi:hypothetical protein
LNLAGSLRHIDVDLLFDARGVPVGTTVGISWYRREHYDELRRLFADGRQLPETFDQWLSDANEGVARIEQMGGVALKAPLDLFDFPRWCKARRLECNFRARQQFVAEFVRQHAASDTPETTEPEPATPARRPRTSALRPQGQARTAKRRTWS